MKPAPIAAGRRPYSKNVPADKWQRLFEIRLCLRGEVTDSDTGRLRCEMALNHFAWLPDGARLMDDWLNDEAIWMPRAERERMKAAAHADMRTYDAVEAGRIAGLLWTFRCEHVIKTMIAIDTPPAHVVKDRHKQLDASRKREVRAEKRALPKPVPANKRRSDDLQKRRVAAIVDVLRKTAEMTVADISAALARVRNGPFNTVDKSSLPNLVRRVVRKDPAFRTEVRQIPGRPDLRGSLWVALRSPIKQERKMDRQLAPTAAPAGVMTEAEYEAHFEKRLAQFTPDTIAEMIAWYRSPTERALLASVGLPLETIRTRVLMRNRELVAQRKARAEA